MFATADVLKSTDVPDREHETAADVLRTMEDYGFLEDLPTPEDSVVDLAEVTGDAEVADGDE